MSVKTTKKPGEDEKALDAKRQEKEQESENAKRDTRTSNADATAEAERVRSSRATMAEQGPLGTAEVARAIESNRALGFSEEAWAQIGAIVGAGSCGIDAAMVQAIAGFQKDSGLEVDGVVDSATRAALVGSPGGQALAEALKAPEVEAPAPAPASQAAATE